MICALGKRGRLFHRNTTCTLHEGSYENAPNIQTFKMFRIDKPSRLALALRFTSKFRTFFISTKEVIDGTYGVLMWRDGTYGVLMWRDDTYGVLMWRDGTYGVVMCRDGDFM